MQWEPVCYVKNILVELAALVSSRMPRNKLLQQQNLINNNWTEVSCWGNRIKEVMPKIEWNQKEEKLLKIMVWSPHKYSN